jgi:2-polyprenyl-3-methyl-5-hydroxy-6-metoxy-1,4-benzoquinol methylase
MTDFDDQFQEHLRNDFYAGMPQEFFDSYEFHNSWKEHAYARTDRFGQYLLPWLNRAFDLRNSDVLEIGCGTGSITAVLAPNAKSVTCIEIDERSMRAAKTRAKLMGWGNVFFEDGAFGLNSDLYNSGREFDAVVLVGVIEHMTFSVMEDILTAARNKLRDNGVIVIADTPNRLSPFDYHSSWLPFFQWLPMEIQRRYYKKSVRPGYVSDLADFEDGRAAEIPDRIQSWGIGVSFHDFELIFGDDVHSRIIADGWDRDIEHLANFFGDDGFLLSVWDHRKLEAHKGFARSWLYLIIRK